MVWESVSARRVDDVCIARSPLGHCPAELASYAVSLPEIETASFKESKATTLARRLTDLIKQSKVSDRPPHVSMQLIREEEKENLIKIVQMILLECFCRAGLPVQRVCLPNHTRKPMRFTDDVIFFFQIDSYSVTLSRLSC